MDRLSLYGSSRVDQPIMIGQVESTSSTQPESINITLTTIMNMLSSTDSRINLLTSKVDNIQHAASMSSLQPLHPTTSSALSLWSYDPLLFIIPDRDPYGPHPIIPLLVILSFDSLFKFQYDRSYYIDLCRRTRHQPFPFARCIDPNLRMSLPMDWDGIAIDDLSDNKFFYFILKFYFFLMKLTIVDVVNSINMEFNENLHLPQLYTYLNKVSFLEKCLSVWRANGTPEEFLVREDKFKAMVLLGIQPKKLRDRVEARKPIKRRPLTPFSRDNFPAIYGSDFDYSSITQSDLVSEIKILGLQLVDEQLSFGIGAIDNSAVSSKPTTQFHRPNLPEEIRDGQKAMISSKSVVTKKNIPVNFPAYVDTACTNTMVNDKAILDNIQSYETPSETHGIGGHVLSYQYGNITNTSLSADLYSPLDLSTSLLSVPALVQKDKVILAGKSNLDIIHMSDSIRIKIDDLVNFSKLSGNHVLSAPMNDNNLYVANLIELVNFKSPDVPITYSKQDILALQPIESAGNQFFDLENMDHHTNMLSQFHLSFTAITQATCRLTNPESYVHFLVETFFYSNVEDICRVVAAGIHLGLPESITPAVIRKYYPYNHFAIAAGSLFRRGGYRTKPTTTHSPARLVTHDDNEDFKASIVGPYPEHTVQIDTLGLIDNSEFPSAKTFSGCNQLVNVIDLDSDVHWSYPHHSGKDRLWLIKQVVYNHSINHKPLHHLVIDSEFDQKNILSYLRDERITWEIAPPHEHNKMAHIERLNRTIEEALVKAKVGNPTIIQEMWGYMAIYFSLIRSLIPSKSHPTQSRFERFYGYKFDFKSTPILPFGINVMAHTPPQLQQKLGDHGRDTIFIGIAPTSRSCARLLDKTTKAIINRRSFKVVTKRDSTASQLSLESFVSSVLPSQDNPLPVQRLSLPDYPIARPGDINFIDDPVVAKTLIELSDVSTPFVDNSLPRSPINTKTKTKKVKNVSKSPDPTLTSDATKRLDYSADYIPSTSVSDALRSNNKIKGRTRTVPTPDVARSILTKAKNIKPKSNRRALRQLSDILKKEKSRKELVSTEPAEPQRQSLRIAAAKKAARKEKFALLARQNQYNIRIKTQYLNSHFEQKELIIPRNMSEINLLDEHGVSWLQAVKDEIEAIKGNDTFSDCDFDLSHLPKGKIVPSQLVFDIRKEPNGTIKKYKCRLVARGDLQKWDTYNDTFADTVSTKSVNLLFSLAAKLDLEMESIDIKTAFLHSLMKEELYLKRPPGLDDTHMPQYVKLNKCIYGLKQAAHEWRQTLHNALTSLGFTQLPSDNCVYRKDTENGKIILAIHVDDVLVAASNSLLIEEFNTNIAKTFDISINNPLTSYLGLSISRDRSKKCISISQPGFISELLATFKLSSENLPDTPMSATPYQKLKSSDNTLLSPEKTTQFMSKVGSLMYLAVHTRPDIAYAIGTCARKMQSPSECDMKAVDRIIRYIDNTKDLCLCFHGDTDQIALTATVDASFACHDDRKSHYGITMHLGNDASFNTISKKAPCVALSSTEAEYLALCEASKLVAWGRQFLDELGFTQSLPTIISEDNKSTIHMVYNGNDKGRTKHIDVRYHYIREMIADKKISVVYLNTEDMISDMLTKPLETKSFIKLRSKLMGHRKISFLAFQVDGLFVSTLP